MLGKLTNTTQLKRTTTNDSTSPTMKRQNDNDNCRDCSENAECMNQGEEKCVCKAGFVGNGQACTGISCLLLYVQRCRYSRKRKRSRPSILIRNILFKIPCAGFLNFYEMYLYHVSQVQVG